MTRDAAGQAKSLPGVRGARRVAIIVIIVSLFVTAVVGIVELLSGDFGELQSKVLLTTLVLAAFSITSLCHLAVVGRTLQLVGFVGIATSVGAFVSALVLIWSNWGASVDMNSWVKALGVFTVLALSFAHGNLLLLLGARKRRPIRIGLLITLTMIAVVAVMAIIPILSDGKIPGDSGDSYWRIFGVVAIVDVLGTIVLPISGIFLKDEGVASTIRLALELPADLVVSLEEYATRHGMTREQAAIDGIRRSLGAREQGTP